jgi:hypothetical protein
LSRRLLKDRVFLSGTLIGALVFALLMATMFLLPLFMQQLRASLPSIACSSWRGCRSSW